MLTATPKYLIWEHWVENGRHPPRPFYSVPKWWFALYKIRHPIPKPIEVYNGFFAQYHGALFRAPGGNIENVQDQKVYLDWSAINLRSDGDWSTQIAQNKKYGVVTLPWQQCFNEQDIDNIFNAASSEPDINPKGHCVLNVEQEILTTLTPSVIRTKIASYQQKHPQAEVALVPLPWVQNGQGWSALKDVPTLLEIFTNENSHFVAADLVQHAYNEGLRIIGCLWGAYPINGQYPDPKMYPLNSYKIQAIYTGDDVQDWNKWVETPVYMLPQFGV